ncbi:MAG: LytR C-terminal domain-containing protein [Ilumatobacteraceae bacterium]|nr:LytR C-terminal domain-containing protein [Ilumatobacteraceae bacterium]
MGSTLAIVIAIAAVVVGFLILKNIRSDDSPSASTQPPITTPDSLVTNTFPVAPIVTQPTVFTPQTSGAKVLVANSSHANGAAGQLSTALQGNQFIMGTPTNGAAKEAVTKVQYLTGDVAAQAVAQSVAALMGVATVEPMPTPVALADPATLLDNTVLVLLGDDKAGKTLAQMVEPASATTTPVGATSSTAAP